MEKIQLKDLTTEYILEKLQDAHPFFKLGKPTLDKYSVGTDNFGDDQLKYARYANTDDNANRSKDALLNYLRHSNRNDLFDIIIKYEKNTLDDIIQAFWNKTIDLSIKYQYKKPYTIGEELSRAHKLVEGNRVDDLFDPHRTTARIRHLFVESPIENCIRLQAIISAPAVEEFVTKFDTYFSNLDVAIEILLEQYKKTKDNQILHVANYIEDNKQALYDNIVKIFKDTNCQSVHGAKIDICDVELDPKVANLSVSVSKVNNLTQEEYEDPIMSDNVLVRPMQLQRSLEELLNYKYVLRDSRSLSDISYTDMFGSGSTRWFLHISYKQHNYTAQKLLVNLNTRLKNSKAKTREREILKTFKSRTAPIIDRIKEIYAEVRPYVKTRSEYHISDELQDILAKDFNTGQHVHTQAILDKITNAVTEMKALCDGYNEEYRRMLDAIAEDL
mgnify:CR=1 FL=1|jgi:hypothetical protein